MKSRAEKLALIALGQNGDKSIKTKKLLSNSTAPTSDIYYQDTEPTVEDSTNGALLVGDLWFDTANSYKLYKYDGTSWSLAIMDENIQEVNGSLIVPNTITATQIASSYIYTGKLSAGQVTAGTLDIGGTDFNIRLGIREYLDVLGNTYDTGSSFYRPGSGSDIGPAIFILDTSTSPSTYPFSVFSENGGAAMFSSIDNTIGTNVVKVSGTSTKGIDIDGNFDYGLYVDNNNGAYITGTTQIQNLGVTGSVSGISYSDVGAAASSHNHDASNITSGTISRPVTTSGNINSGGSGTFSGSLAVNGRITTHTGFWVGGTQVAFTAGHIVFSDQKLIPGEVVVANSTYGIQLTQTHAMVSPSNNVKDTKVHGVVCEEIVNKDDLIDFARQGIEHSSFDESYEGFISLILDNNYKLYTTMAIGEGQMLVCSENGDIAGGDFICSSSKRGLGMKQDDGLLHNYTIAKAANDIVWSEEDSDSKLLEVTFHCG